MENSRPRPSSVTFSAPDGTPILDPDDNAAHLLNKFLPDDDPNADTAHHCLQRPLASRILDHIRSTPNNAPCDISADEVCHSYSPGNPFGGAGPNGLKAFTIQWVADLLSPSLAKIYTACLKF